MKVKLLVLFILFINIADCQGNFMVYQMIGEVKTTINNQHKSIKMGQLLKANSSLFIGKESGVVLICDNYTPFTVKTAGTWTLASFIDSCDKETQSLTSGYFKYMWTQLRQTEKNPGEDRREFMRNSGAVVRGYPCNEITIDPLFDTINIRNGNLRLRWKTTLPPNKFTIECYDAEKDGKLLYRSGAPGNYIMTDSIKKYARGNEMVYWNFVLDGKEICNRKLFHIWKTNDFKIYLENMKKMIPPGTGDAERFYMTGFLLESGHFFAQAREFYQKAVRLNSREKRYRLALDELN